MATLLESIRSIREAVRNAITQTYVTLTYYRRRCVAQIIRFSESTFHLMRRSVSALWRGARNAYHFTLSILLPLPRWILTTLAQGFRLSYRLLRDLVSNIGPFFVDFARNIYVLFSQIPSLLLPLARHSYRVFKQMLTTIFRLLQTAALHVTSKMLVFLQQSYQLAKWMIQNTGHLLKRAIISLFHEVLHLPYYLQQIGLATKELSRLVCQQLWRLACHIARGTDWLIRKILFAISKIAGITLGVIAALIDVIAAGTLFLLKNSMGLLVPSLFTHARVTTPTPSTLPPAIDKPSKNFTPRYQKKPIASLSSNKTDNRTQKRPKPRS